MPINDHIERWALNQGADRLALAVINGQITLDDLGEITRRKPVFASKFALVQQQLETMPNPKEKEEYDVIVAQYGVDKSSEEIFNKMSVYVSRWNGNTAAADRVSEVKGWMSIIKEMNDYQRLAARVPADLSAYEASGKVPSVEVEQALKMYLAQWNGGGIASDEHLNKVEDWSRRVVTIRKQKVENDWNALFDADGKLISIDLLKEFAQLYSSATDYSSRIDDLYWEWAMSQSDVLSAAADYNGYYNGMGKHSPEVAGLQSLYREWQAIDNTDIFEVIKYIEDHPDTPFKSEANRLMQLLKTAELERMRREPSVYSDAKFRRLSTSGACSKEELVDAVGGSEEVYDRIMNLESTRRDCLRRIPDPIEQTFEYGGLGKTDIVFFGMPSSGKTCVLTGLFASERLTPDPSDWNGRYATALQSYGEAMIAPPRTQTRFVAVVNCEIYKKNKDKQLKVPFNLVDMAGEDFQNQIVQIDDLGSANISFDSMGQGAPEILANDHDKVFFVLIDPTAVGSRDVIQKDAIRTLVGLFENPANRSIMRRVRGLHFIVTKADTLTGPRLDSARKSVCKILNEASRTKLVNFCRELGINSSKEVELDGHPRVFCFSLGTFHPGNIYSGSQRDSETILNVISDYVVAERYDSVGRKVRRFFTQPLL